MDGSPMQYSFSLEKNGWFIDELSLTVMIMMYRINCNEGIIEQCTWIMSNQYMDPSKRRRGGHLHVSVVRFMSSELGAG